jgi:outer membrane protein assembly factor BamB
MRPDPEDSPMRTKDRDERSASSPAMRWWMPVTIVTLAALAFVVLRLWKSLEAHIVWSLSLLTTVVAAFLLLIWFVLFTKLRWRIRLAALAAVILAVFAATMLVRYDGSADGTAFPQFAWNWTPKKSGEVGAFNQRVLVESPSKIEVTAQADYPGFLGRERNGIVEAVELHGDWNAHPPQQLWRQPIGLGWSAFAVTGSQAVTQEQRGDNELTVCYELATGHVLWAHTNVVRFSESMGGDGPRATPTLNEGRVYALGATGILDCLELSGGKVIWSRDILKECQASNQMFGKACSPLLIEDLVVVSGAPTNGPSLLAYRASDGSPAWQSGTNALDISYSSPAAATLHGTRQILMLNAAHISGHDPRDGRILWEYRWSEAAKSIFIGSQPVVIEGDRVFLSAGFGAGCVLLQINADDNGKFSAVELWKNRNMKTHFSTVVTRDGFAYGLDDGILACLDLATGQRRWKDGRYGRGQVVRSGGFLLVQTEPGPIVLVEANPSAFREVARLEALSAKTWNNPALAGGFLLARNDQEAVCYKCGTRQIVLWGETSSPDLSPSRK